MKRILLLAVALFLLSSCTRYVHEEPQMLTEKIWVKGENISTFVDLDIDIPSDIYANNLYIKGNIAEDIRFPVESIRTLGASNIPGYEPFLGETYVYTFSPSTMEQGFVTVQLPHRRRQNSTIYPHFHWSPSTTNLGDVQWCIEFTSANIGDTFPATTTRCVNDSAEGTTYQHLMTNYYGLNITNSLSESSIATIRIFRNATSGEDTYADDAFLLEFDVHYIIGKMGEDY